MMPQAQSIEFWLSVLLYANVAYLVSFGRFVSTSKYVNLICHLIWIRRYITLLTYRVHNGVNNMKVSYKEI